MTKPKQSRWVTRLDTVRGNSLGRIQPNISFRNAANNREKTIGLKE